MESMKVIHCGFDGLDAAFSGAVPSKLWEIFDGKKKDAQENDGKPQYVNINGFEGHVGESGARGGFAYRIDTGPEGEVWFFKRSECPDKWNVRVSVKSATIAMYGYQKVKEQLFERLSCLGIKATDNRVSRVDVCLDLLMPKGWNVDPARFVSRADRHDHQEGETNVNVVWSQGNCSGVTIGKMPGRQFCIYDKRREVSKKQKAEWWEIWQAKNPNLDELSKENKPNIWRVEFRAGKEHLRKKWNLRTFEDLEASLADVIRAGFKAIKYCIPSADSNRSRWDTDPVWISVASHVVDLFSEYESGLVEGQLCEVARHEKVKGLEAQIKGLHTSLSGLVYDRDSSVPATEFACSVAEHLCEMLKGFVKGDKEAFLKKMLKARDRYNFLEEREPFSSGLGTVMPDLPVSASLQSKDQEMNGGESDPPF